MIAFDQDLAVLAAPKRQLIAKIDAFKKRFEFVKSVRTLGEDLEKKVQFGGRTESDCGHTIIPSRIVLN